MALDTPIEKGACRETVIDRLPLDPSQWIAQQAFDHCRFFVPSNYSGPVAEAGKAMTELDIARSSSLLLTRGGDLHWTSHHDNRAVSQLLGMSVPSSHTSGLSSNQQAMNHFSRALSQAGCSENLTEYLLSSCNQGALFAIDQWYDYYRGEYIQVHEDQDLVVSRHKAHFIRHIKVLTEDDVEYSSTRYCLREGRSVGVAKTTVRITTRGGETQVKTTQHERESNMPLFFSDSFVIQKTLMRMLHQKKETLSTGQSELRQCIQELQRHALVCKTRKSLLESPDEKKLKALREVAYYAQCVLAHDVLGSSQKEKKIARSQFNRVLLKHAPALNQHRNLLKRLWNSVVKLFYSEALKVHLQAKKMTIFSPVRSDSYKLACIAAKVVAG